MSLPIDELGLCYICRMCSQMEKAKRHGADACGVPACGGPSKGLAFPWYAGPLPRAWFTKYCYKCGKNATKKMVVKGKGELGLCDVHAEGLT